MAEIKFTSNAARAPNVAPFSRLPGGRTPGRVDFLPDPGVNDVAEDTRTPGGRKYELVPGGVAAVGVTTPGAYTGDGQYTATQASTDGAGTGATFTVTITASVLATVDAILTPGSGYLEGDVITLAIVGPTTTTAATLTVTALA